MLGALAPRTVCAVSHELPVPEVRPDGNVDFRLSTCFWDPPPDGFLPLRVEVTNDGARPRQWTLQFQAIGDFTRASTYESAQTLSVGAGESRVFDLHVPLQSRASAAEEYGINSELRVVFSGPGVSPAEVSLFTTRHLLARSTGTKGLSPWIGMSESLAVRHWEPAKSLLASAHATLLVGSRFDPACLPTDWRNYVAFSVLALTSDEWRDTAPAARDAIEHWVAAGGNLWLVGAGDTAERIGFGRRRGWPALTPEIVAETITGPRVRARANYTDWELIADVGQPALRKGLVLGFLGGFALLVGPVNLFAFCRGKQRHRILWTTPLLSVVASLALAGSILVQDGTGGDGERTVIVGLWPERHEAVVLQEQLARSGLLINSGFTTTEPLFIEPVRITAERTVGRTRLRVQDQTFSGDWFASRAVRGHYLETVRPSRARFEIERVEGAPPRLLSTVPDAFADVYWIDTHGKFWRTADVSPGRKADFTRTDAAQFEKWWSQRTASMGPRLRHAAAFRPGLVFAHARGATAAIATHSAIRWKDRGALYMQQVD